MADVTFLAKRMLGVSHSKVVNTNGGYGIEVVSRSALLAARIIRSHHGDSLVRWYAWRLIYRGRCG